MKNSKTHSAIRAGDKESWSRPLEKGNANQRAHDHQDHAEGHRSDCITTATFTTSHITFALFSSITNVFALIGRQ